MRPKHVYDYAVLPGSVGSIVPRMISSSARVLELGTGPGTITKQLHAKGCRIVGMDIDSSAIPMVAPYCECVFHADLNAPNWGDRLGEDKFDTVVMTDVLEHLLDPWKVLETVKNRLVPGGSVVISLPNVGHIAILAGLLNGRFDYGQWGLLDKTHLRFFGLRNIQSLIDSAGMKIIEADFVVREPDRTEFESSWKTIPEAQREILTSNPYAKVYQVVIKAVDLAVPGRPLDLLSLAIPPAATEKLGRKLGSKLLHRLTSPRFRHRIVSVLERFGVNV